MPLDSWLLLALLAAPQAPPPTPPSTPANPVLEAGASYHEVWDDASPRTGPWHTVHASLFWQPPLRVRPMVDVERQSRPSGAHARVSAGAYVDWTPTFYSHQSLSLARTVQAERRFYPERRVDVRLFWKVPQHTAVTLAGGYTVLTFGSPQRSQIVNLGTIIYGNRVITQATVYFNRNDPGSLNSAAGNFSIQVGAEGRGWYGVSISGGRELYRLGTVGTAETADFRTATVGGFVRRWLTSKAGVHGSVEYQRIIGSYSRVGVTGRLFIGF
jgi:YaiO family outer membrane protein